MEVAVQRPSKLRGLQFKVSLPRTFSGIGRRRSKPENVTQVSNAMETTHKIGVSPDVELHVNVWQPGSPTSRPTLLPLHFWGGSSESWATFNAQLKNDFNIITPSLRGWGESSKTTDTQVYQTSHYAQDVVALIKHFQTAQPDLVSNGIILIGHSLGGKIAQKILTIAEAELHVRGVVLVGPSPSSGSHFSEEMKERMVHVFDSVESAEMAFKNFLLGRKAIDDRALVRSLADVAVASGKEAVAAFPRYGCAENFQTELAAAIPRFRKQGKPLKVVVVEGGERPENAQELVVDVLEAAGADVTFRGLESGHLMPQEVPVELANLVRGFVDDV